MKENGFLKRSQKFRSDVSNGKYFPILEKLHEIASKHQNNLPSSFSIDNLYGVSTEDVNYVFSSLYPERIYSCSKLNDSTIFCIRN